SHQNPINPKPKTDDTFRQRNPVQWYNMIRKKPCLGRVQFEKTYESASHNHEVKWKMKEKRKEKKKKKEKKEKNKTPPTSPDTQQKKTEVTLPGACIIPSSLINSPKQH